MSREKNPYAIDRKKTILCIKNRQNEIVYESEDDEGAAEYYAELQSIINALEYSDEDSDSPIIEAFEYVGHTFADIIYNDNTRGA